MSELVSTGTDQSEADLRQLESLARYAAKLEPYLADVDVTEVSVNADGQLWIKLRGKYQLAGQFPTRKVDLILRSVATIRNIPLSHDAPFLETSFPLDGSRIEGILPPVSAEPVMTIRLRPRRIYSLNDYVKSGILTDQADPINAFRHRDRFLEQALPGLSHVEILRLAIQYRLNILIAGGTHTGKTTFLNGNIAEINALTPIDRLLIIEDTPELQSSVPNTLALLSTDKISQAQCLEASLRLGPDRIIVGEVRRSTSADVLVMAWNTGHTGGFATIHANGAKEALYRLDELLPDPKNARARVARAVGLVVFIDEELSVSAHRKVREIMIVDGLDADGDYICKYV